MRQVWRELAARVRVGEDVSMATVVESASPRVPVGTSTLLSAEGALVADLLGGQFSTEVRKLLVEVQESGSPTVRELRGAGDPGDGPIVVFFECVAPGRFPAASLVIEELDAGRALAQVTVVSHPDPDQLGRRAFMTDKGELHGSVGPTRLDRMIAKVARRTLISGRSRVMPLSVDTEVGLDLMKLFVSGVSDIRAPHPAIDFAAARFGEHFTLRYRNQK